MNQCDLKVSCCSYLSLTKYFLKLRVVHPKMKNLLNNNSGLFAYTFKVSKQHWTPLTVNVWTKKKRHFSKCHLSCFFLISLTTLNSRYWMNSSPKKQNVSPSGHTRCRCVCFFIGKDLEKCISLAHQWILCSEWVPSVRMRVQTAD